MQWRGALDPTGGMRASRLLAVMLQATLLIQVQEAGMRPMQ